MVTMGRARHIGADADCAAGTYATGSLFWTRARKGQPDTGHLSTLPSSTCRVGPRPQTPASTSHRRPRSYERSFAIRALRTIGKNPDSRRGLPARVERRSGTGTTMSLSPTARSVIAAMPSAAVALRPMLSELKVFVGVRVRRFAAKRPDTHRVRWVPGARSLFAMKQPVGQRGRDAEHGEADDEDPDRCHEQG